jgi:hypothetical protein
MAKKPASKFPKNAPSIKNHKEPGSINIKFYEGYGTFAPVRQAKKRRSNKNT